MPTTKVDKVIVTNLTALKAKYGVAGVQKIQTSIQGLIAADQKRGLVTQIIALDDVAAMKQVGATPVTKTTDPKQNKNAIDAVYKVLAPDYLMILGAVDVIPHQNLKNPMFSPLDDPDRFAYGDIPYACESKYSQNIKNFFGPTRVVGRLPDITGTKDPQYLITLLNVSANYKNIDAGSYRAYFGISAEIWKDSTALSLSNTFGNAANMSTVPPKNANWPAPSLQRLAHFINCHGAANDSRFFGQPASGAQSYPISLDADFLNNKVSEGTVIAAECCYGGQLFDPTLNGGKTGISSTYLANKAYGFFGSTTIAYGPSSGNDSADLLCQYFLQSLMKGASLGRAALEARQKFIHTASMSEPDNVKTIAQFNLYADPSITPVKLPHTMAVEAKGLVAQSAAEMRVKRTERRRDLFSRGLALGKSQPIINPFTGKLPASVISILGKKTSEHGITLGNTLSFSIQTPSSSKSMPMRLVSKDVFPSRVYVIFHKQENSKEKGIDAKSRQPQVQQTIALIVKELNGSIVSDKKVYSR